MILAVAVPVRRKSGKSRSEAVMGDYQLIAFNREFYEFGSDVRDFGRLGW